MIKSKRKHRTTYYHSLRFRLGCVLPATIFYVGGAALFLPIIIILINTTTSTTSEWFVKWLCGLPTMLFITLYAALWGQEFLESLLFERIIISDEGIEWRLYGMQGFSTWGNIECFGWHPLTNNGSSNQNHLRLREPVELKMNRWFTGFILNFFRNDDPININKKHFETCIPIGLFINTTKPEEHPMIQQLQTYIPHVLQKRCPSISMSKRQHKQKREQL